MNITLHQVGKRFQKHPVFRNIDYTFSAPTAYALLGSNGSGKSTLLRIIAGIQAPSTGTVTYTGSDSRQHKPTEAFLSTSLCAPGMEVVEEFTLREFLNFHFSFKAPLPGLSISDIIDLTGLNAAADKPVFDYSSGMKQRVKLVQAICSNTPVLLLDEPCTNLDEQGILQYRDWIDRFRHGRLVIVASNDPREYYFCTERLSMEDFR